PAVRAGGEDVPPAWRARAFSSGGGVSAAPDEDGRRSVRRDRGRLNPHERKLVRETLFCYCGRRMRAQYVRQQVGLALVANKAREPQAVVVIHLVGLVVLAILDQQFDGLISSLRRRDCGAQPLL